AVPAADPPARSRAGSGGPGAAPASPRAPGGAHGSPGGVSSTEPSSPIGWQHRLVDGYDASTYGDRFADVYDDWYAEISDVDATVERVAALAGELAPPARGVRRPAVLELGPGSGRLAIPLAARGIEVWAVDASAAMVQRLAATPGGDRVHARVSDLRA